MRRLAGVSGPTFRAVSAAQAQRDAWSGARMVLGGEPTLRAVGA